MKRITRPLIAGSTFVIVVALLSGLLWFTLAHAQWSSSRSSSGLVNAGPAAEPGVITVDIDVKPGSDPNSTNLGSRGVISVAILTMPDFDAASVDPATVRFEGAAALHDGLEDVDGDGDLDLIMHFRTQHAEIAEDATEACLTGETFDGQAIEGCDAIRLVPPWLDTDADGFGDAVEATVGTDQSAACTTSPGHDAWPPDFDRNTSVDLLDLLVFKPHFNADLGEPDYELRVDLNADGSNNLLDLLPLKPNFNRGCA
jgi:hypothetical protein